MAVDDHRESWPDCKAASGLHWRASGRHGFSASLRPRSICRTPGSSADKRRRHAAAGTVCRKSGGARGPGAAWRGRSRAHLGEGRASHLSRCCAVCGTGKYSSLDTIWVGTGEGNDDVSAGSRPLIISSVGTRIASSTIRSLPSFYRHRGRLPNAALLSSFMRECDRRPVPVPGEARRRTRWTASPRLAHSLRS